MGSDTYPFTLGDYTCLAIRDGEIWGGNVLLVTTDQYRVLVDTGIGATTSPPGLLLDRLRAAGIDPATIDRVVLTHADVDHIGGAIDARGKLTFPKARYVLSRDEWTFWSVRPERLRPTVPFEEDFRRWVTDVPLQHLTRLRDQLDLIDAGTEIVPGVRALGAPGHTPGYSVIEISSRGAQCLVIGDLLVEPSTIADPDWYSELDYDPAQVVVTRRRVLERAAQEQILLLTYHLPFPGLGHVVQEGPGWQWIALEASA